MSELQALAQQIRDARGVAHKSDIAQVVATLQAPLAADALAANGAPAAGPALDHAVPVGDDCAAWRDGDGYLLFAGEGLVSDFIEAEPWFAGYCGVMVNVSDVYAMGGRPLAVVDAIWSRGAAAAAPMLEGLRAGARAYGVPIVGGHTNQRSDRDQLAVSILGRANRLLTSFDAHPGQHLVTAIDLRGRFHEPFPYWDASTGTASQRLLGDLALLPMFAENAWCGAAKDISMAGIVGTAMMFAECSGCGLTIDVDAIPRPDVPLSRWLGIFPSYGFLLAVDDVYLDRVLGAFAARDLAAARIGTFDAGHAVRLRRGPDAGRDAASGANAGPAAETATVWDFSEAALIGCGGGMPRTGGATA